MEPSEARQRLEEERRRLVALRDRASHDLGDDRQTGGSELSSIDQHGADVATELHDREVGESVLEGLEAELEAVDRALERVDNGTYGRCEECGEAIPEERLAAIPAARFCTRHQQRQEAVR